MKKIHIALQYICVMGLTPRNPEKNIFLHLSSRHQNITVIRIRTACCLFIAEISRSWYALVSLSGQYWRDAVKGLGLSTESYQVSTKASKRLLRQWVEATEERLGHPTNQRARKLPRALPPDACQGEWHVAWLQQIEVLLRWFTMSRYGKFFFFSFWFITFLCLDPSDSVLF